MPGNIDRMQCIQLDSQIEYDRFLVVCLGKTGEKIGIEKENVGGENSEKV